MDGAGANEILLNVVVVDDEEDTRLFFKDILQDQADFKFIGQFSDAKQALVGIPQLNPDIVLMDIRMPGLSGIECMRRLKITLPELKVVIVTGNHDGNSVRHSMEAGATAYLVKPVGVDQCLATLRFASINRQKHKRDLINFKHVELLNKGSGPNFHLSPREREVMICLANGLLYKEIAEKLKISYAAVHKYQHKIFQKFKVSNRSEAIRIWFDLNMPIKASRRLF